jgi:hypothetical protein
VLNAVLGFMKPEVGNLSWVANETIARTTPYGKRTVAHYLTAATLIGAITVAYRTARAAHRGTIGFYPNYTEHTYGKTFPMLIKAELDNNGRVKPKTLNFYRLNRNWIGYSMVPEYLPDWMLEVIRLCATKTAANVRAAKRLAAIHHIRCQTKDKKAIANEWANTMTHKLCVYASAPESASANEGVRRPCVLSTRKQGDEGPAPSSASENAIANDPADTLPDSPVRLESVIVNDPARTTTHKLCVYALTTENAIVNDPARGGQVVPRKEHGDEGSAPSSAIEEKQEPGAGKPVLAVSGLKAGPGHLEVLTPENDTPSAHQLRREELEYTASYGDTDALITLLNEDETLLNENAASGRASSPEPFAAKAAPGSTEVSPPVTTEDTNPARVRLSWGQHRQTAAQSRQDKATEKQESGAGTPALAVSGLKAGPGHTEVLTPEKAPPPSSQRSVMIKQHQAYLARLAAMRTELEQAGLKGEILEEALRQMMKDD